MLLSQSEVDSIVSTILRSKKYRGMSISRDTVYDLVTQEFPRYKKKTDVIKAVKGKLHHVVAPYLGNPDYESAARELRSAYETNDWTAIKKTCLNIMAAHASSRERLSFVADFYRTIFDVTGKPGVLSDIACGLNPLSFPWMELPNSTLYYAYDLYGERVDFLNVFFTLQGLTPLAKFQDVLVTVPAEQSDVALILKEMHRFEQRHRGCTLSLLDALRAEYIVVSLPAMNLSGRRNLVAHHQRLFYTVVKERAWQVTEIQIENELVFIIRKDILAVCQSGKRYP